MAAPSELLDIIKRGDRVDLKAWLQKATDRDLHLALPTMLGCTVQDFFNLFAAETKRRGLTR